MLELVEILSLREDGDAPCVDPRGTGGIKALARGLVVQWKQRQERRAWAGVLPFVVADAVELRQTGVTRAVSPETNASRPVSIGGVRSTSRSIPKHAVWRGMSSQFPLELLIHPGPAAELTPVRSGPLPPVQSWQKSPPTAVLVPLGPVGDAGRGHNPAHLVEHNGVDHFVVEEVFSGHRDDPPVGPDPAPRPLEAAERVVLAVREPGDAAGTSSRNW